MYSAIDDYILLQSNAAGLKGVFSTKDLANLLDVPGGVPLYRRIHRLVHSGSLQPFARGYYTFRSPDIQTLCMRVDPRSYISLGSALARHLMIGTCPSRTVFAVSPGRNRTIAGPAGTLIYVSAQETLFFGIENAEGIRYATPEKALLDTLYYHLKGTRFYFNLFTDVNLDTVDTARVRSWLRRYRNPRFKTFVERYLDERVSR